MSATEYGSKKQTSIKPLCLEATSNEINEPTTGTVIFGSRSLTP